MPPLELNLCFALDRRGSSELPRVRSVHVYEFAGELTAADRDALAKWIGRGV